MEALAIILSVGAAIYVAGDAGSRNSASWFGWAIATLLFLPIAFPIYLAVRPLREGEIRKGGAGWHACRNLVLMWAVVVVGAATFEFRAQELPTDYLVVFLIVFCAPAAPVLALGLILRRKWVRRNTPLKFGVHL